VIETTRPVASTSRPVHLFLSSEPKSVDCRQMVCRTSFFSKECEDRKIKPEGTVSQESLSSRRRSFNPDSEKPFKDRSISCPDSAEKWQFHRKRAPFYLENRL